MTIDADEARAAYERWVREICPNGLGSDHAWGWWPFEGGGQSRSDLAWSHRCTNHGGRTALVVARIDLHTGAFHTLVSRHPLHIEASILCRACGDHGHIREGRWTPA